LPTRSRPVRGCFYLNYSALALPVSMKEKHVTIDPSTPSSPCGDARSGLNAPKHDTISCRGTSSPRLMLFTGQDGYRTPTHEEYELHSDPSVHGQFDGGLLNSNSHHRQPHTPPTLLVNPSSVSLAHSVLEKLQWRERIRHYTWTFFTMTMATGGIANVLYTGMVELEESATKLAG